MTNEEITIAKFHACMRNSVKKLRVFELNKKKESREYDFKDFDKICIKHDLEEYSELLYNYFLDLLEHNRLNYNSYNSYFTSIREHDEYCLDLLETIHFLHSILNDEIKSITLQKSKVSHQILNERLIYDIEQNLNSLFTRNFKSIYSNEEADNELRKQKNKKWFTDRMKEYEFQSLENIDFVFEDIEDNQIFYPKPYYEQLTGKELKIEIINSFRKTNPKVCELSLKNIEHLKHEIQNRLKRKKGPPKKNLHIAILAFELEDILKIEKLMKNNENSEIDNIALNSNDYRFIYDCLDFWGFLPSDEIQSPKQNYIRTSILKPFKESLPSDYLAEREEIFNSLNARLGRPFPNSN